MAGCVISMRGPRRNLFIYFKIKCDFKEGGVLLNRGMFLESPRAKEPSDVMRKPPFCAGPLIRGQMTKWVTVDSMVNNVGLVCFVMRIVVHIDLSRVSIPFEDYAARPE